MSIKQFLSRIDRVIFNEALRRFYFLYFAKKNIRYKSNIFNHEFDIHYKKNDDSLLNTLSDKYGSDKGEVSPDSNPYPWRSHNYADFYSLIFGLRRTDVKSVIECGLGTNNPTLKSSMGVNGKPGASLRMWKDYFPNASIFGCDIDRDVLFSEERIKTFHCDQTSAKSIRNFLKNADISVDSVDIIIDDGLHE